MRKKVCPCCLIMCASPQQQELLELRTALVDAEHQAERAMQTCTAVQHSMTEASRYGIRAKAVLCRKVHALRQEVAAGRTHLAVTGARACAATRHIGMPVICCLSVMCMNYDDGYDALEMCTHTVQSHTQHIWRQTCAHWTSNVRHLSRRSQQARRKNQKTMFNANHSDINCVCNQPTRCCRVSCQQAQTVTSPSTTFHWGCFPAKPTPTNAWALLYQHLCSIFLR